ncbi:MAG: gliding motility lipoprotein GldB [Flavobacteriales bacterium]|nr:gliding motility lipoprotein GldB [Flavobacteriales bacterium]
MIRYKSYLLTLQSLLVCLFFNFYGCAPDKNEIDVSDIDLSLKIKRFDKELFSLEKVTENDVLKFQQDYGVFFTQYVENIISISEVHDPSVYYYLNAFKNDEYVNEVQKKVNESFSDFSTYEKQFNDAFKHYKHYFPKNYIPEIITYTSGFNYAIAVDSSFLGIGLDMFLGADYKPYVQLGLPQYKTANMTPKNLVPSAVLAWVGTEFIIEKPDATLLEEMIHQGKLLYALDLLMPSESDELKIGYTNQQVEWCYNNEKQIWFYFVDNELFYTKDTKEIIKYMGEAPFVQGFPEGSPGKVGHWIGWQIVKKYMENNPNISLENLLEEKDAQKILNGSKYKP